MSVEGGDQGEPLQAAGDLEEELYPFDSDIPQIELSPELTPNLDASKREDLHTLILQFPSAFNAKPTAGLTARLDSAVRRRHANQNRNMVFIIS